MAKLEGWARQYPGMVNRKHADGTFDIVFDDGDRARKHASRPARRHGRSRAAEVPRERRHRTPWLRGEK